MASAWGDAWGSSWGDAWGSVAAALVGGKGDNAPAKQRSSIKPTGLVERRPEKRRDVEQRVEEAEEIHAEVREVLALEFTEETRAIEARPPIVEMALANVEAEIGSLLRKKLMTQEDEVLLLLLMAAASCA